MLAKEKKGLISGSFWSAQIFSEKNKYFYAQLCSFPGWLNPLTLK